MASHKEFDDARKRADARLKKAPRAISARFDRKRGQIVIKLSSSLELSFPSEDAQGLEHASAADLQEIEISPSGFGIHFPRLDADLYLPELLEGLLGSRRWMAARLGAEGGRARTSAKKTASRANGKLGGRPRKAKAG